MQDTSKLVRKTKPAKRTDLNIIGLETLVVQLNERELSQLLRILETRYYYNELDGRMPRVAMALDMLRNVVITAGYEE